MKVTKFRLEMELLEKLLASNTSKEKGTFVFKKDKDGNVIIEPYKLKAFFEDAAEALFYDKPDIRQKIDNNLFVRRVAVVPPKKPDGVLPRPVVIKTPEGKKASLIKSEYLDKGAKIVAEIEIIPANAVSLDIIKDLLAYGERKGLGAWRKAGYGSFKTITLEPVNKILK